MTLATVVSTLRTRLAADAQIDSAWLFTDDDESTPEVEALRRAVGDSDGDGIAILITMPMVDDSSQASPTVLSGCDLTLSVLVNPSQAATTAKALCTRIRQVVAQANETNRGALYLPPRDGPAMERDDETAQATGLHVYQLYYRASASDPAL